MPTYTAGNEETRAERRSGLTNCEREYEDAAKLYGIDTKAIRDRGKQRGNNEDNSGNIHEHSKEYQQHEYTDPKGKFCVDNAEEERAEHCWNVVYRKQPTETGCRHDKNHDVCGSLGGIPHCLLVYAPVKFFIEKLCGNYAVKRGNCRRFGGSE